MNDAAKALVEALKKMNAAEKRAEAAEAKIDELLGAMRAAEAKMNASERMSRYLLKDWKDAQHETFLEVQKRELAEIRAEAAEAKLEDALGDVAKLRAFAQELFEDWPDLFGVDGFELQDIAIKHGLLKMVSEPLLGPCSEHCACAEYYSAAEFLAGTVTCYRKTSVLLGTAITKATGQA